MDRAPHFLSILKQFQNAMFFYLTENALKASHPCHTKNIDMIRNDAILTFAPEKNRLASVNVESIHFDENTLLFGKF